MPSYVNKALYVFTPESESYTDDLKSNSQGTNILPVSFEQFMDLPDRHLAGLSHVVVSGPLSVIKSVLEVSRERGLTLGILPTSEQKTLKKYLALPDDMQSAIELALRDDTTAMDLILCNDKIMLFRATIGRLPLLDSPGDISLWRVLRRVRSRLKGLRLLGFNFTTAGGRTLKTAACGSMIVQHHRGSLASRLIEHDSSPVDGMISLIIAAPLSTISYLRFLARALGMGSGSKRLPSTIGYIKSKEIVIESERKLSVFIDGESLTETPVHCQVIPRGLKVNVGDSLTEEFDGSESDKERLDVQQLPTGNELTKARKKSIPFFAYASEERFRDLFTLLRDDARLNASFVTLMVLSTVLATVGLYLNSSSVVIGAMLLAPLMTPIVSLAMGLLRRDARMTNDSVVKIAAGICIALIAAAAVSVLFPHKPVTDEMLARLSPSLLDLGVAIFAGIAGAYTKSYKEIMQSLAGVAIAVALVPPLAVAGTGMGRLDPHFFSQAFLLFSTNLIGIVLSAALTFRVLGYSAAVQNKRSIGFVALTLALITVPLYFTYDDLVRTWVFEKNWQHERFLVNGKYLIVEKAKLIHHGDKDVLNMKILARERLSREDMDSFQKKIQTNFSNKLVIRADITYIL